MLTVYHFRELMERSSSGENVRINGSGRRHIQIQTAPSSPPLLSCVPSGEKQMVFTASRCPTGATVTHGSVEIQ